MVRSSKHVRVPLRATEEVLMLFLAFSTVCLWGQFKISGGGGEEMICLPPLPPPLFGNCTLAECNMLKVLLREPRPQPGAVTLSGACRILHLLLYSPIVLPLISMLELRSVAIPLQSW